ncbi:MAG: DUF1559 domain-containing protein [Capsulimonadaceae bacterium]|nr:DUF1559 domain-containing protein [Capsulimonadaceae bacterium]
MFAQAREKARGTACLSNLKQLGLAYTQYEQDYDECVPCGTWILGRGLGWAGQILPYVKTTKAYLCPDDTNPIDVVSYGVNANLSAETNSGSTPPAPAQVSMMAGPAQTVLLFEVMDCSGFTLAAGEQSSPAGWGTSNVAWNTLDGGNAISGSTTSSSLKYATGVLANASAIGPPATVDNNPLDIASGNSFFMGQYGRHQNGSNWLMCDCHAKWLNGSAVGAGQDIVGSQPAACPPSLNYAAPKVGCNLTSSSQAYQYAATFSVH